MRRAVNIALLLFGALALGAGWLLTTTRFAVKRIEFFGLVDVRRSELERLLPFSYGDNLLFVSTRAARRSILRDPRIEDVRVRRRLPDGVEVFVREKTPSYLLCCGKVWGITSAGDAIPIKDVRKLPSLPVISVVENYSPKPYRRVVAPSARRALEFLNFVAKTKPAFLGMISEVVSPREGEYVVFLADGGTQVVFPESSPKLFERLEFILRQLGPAADSVAEIDLRFPDQGIVRFVGCPRGRRGPWNGRG